MRFFLRLILFTTILFSQTDERLESFSKSSLSKIDDPLTTYYSNGFSERAEKLSVILNDASIFYKNYHSGEPKLYLALLNEDDWKNFRGGFPYGLPNVSSSGNRSIIFLPADNRTGAVAEVYKNIYGRIDDSIKTKIDDYESAYSQMIDIIGFHELGHSVARNSGMNFRLKWFDEFIATYIAYDFLINEQPDLAATFDVMAECGLSGINPKHSTLNDFEKMYVRVGVENYMWYQSKFLEIVKKVYQNYGRRFIDIIGDEKIYSITELTELHEILSELNNSFNEFMIE